MGITYEIEQSRTHTHRGRQSVCYSIYAFHKDKKEYEQHHCYSEKGGGVVYEEGNEVIGPGDGIFAYLGMNSYVRKYFENKTRELAKEYFSN